MGGFSMAVAFFLLAVAINGVLTTPTKLERGLHDVQVVSAVAMPKTLSNSLIHSTSGSLDTENLETKITPTSASELEEGRGRKKKYKKFLYHQFWNIMYYYAWAVGIVVVKFKAVLLFLFGNLTFFTIALLRVLIKEVPMWNYLKKPASPPSPVYGQPQYKYGPPASNYGPTSPTYGTPQSNYDSSYSPAGLYKRQGPDNYNGNDGSNAHEIAYSGQRE